MNFFHNRKVIGMICVGIAVFTAFGLSVSNNAGDNTVVQITANIVPGQLIEDKHVTTIKVSQKINNTFTEKSEVVGKYAGIRLYQDEILNREKVLDTPYGDSNALSTLDENQNAASITIKTLAKGLSGKLQRGDIVSIIDTGETMNSAVIVPELNYVEVLAVTTSTGADTEDLTQNSTESIPAAVTLKVSPLQAVRLAAIEEKGNAHLVLVSRGNQDKAKELLNKQQESLSEKAGTEG